MEKTRKNILILGLIVSMILTLIPINSYAASKIKVTSVSFGQTVYVLQKGKSKTLSVSVAPSKAANKSVSFKSSNTSIATVNSKGTVSAKKTGTVTITAAAKDGSKKKTTCTVKIVSSIKKVTSIKLSSSTKSIYVGKTLTLKAAVSPSKASLKTLKFTSSNTKVATVSAKGVVKGIKAGSVTITATALDGSKKKAAIKITVKNIAVKKISLSSSAFNLVVGKTKTLSAAVTPSNATIKSITWKSSNTKVATVTSKGVIKGIKKGTATISAAAKDGSGKKASILVTIKNPEENAEITLDKWYAYVLDQNAKLLKMKNGSSITTMNMSKLVDSQVALGMSVALPDITPLETLYEFLRKSNSTGFSSILFGKNIISDVNFTKDTSISLNLTYDGKVHKVKLTKKKSSTSADKKEVTVKTSIAGKDICLRGVFAVDGGFSIYVSLPGSEEILSTPLLSFSVKGNTYQMQISRSLNANICVEYPSFINFKNVELYNVY